MPLKFKISDASPAPHEVFEAVVDPDQLSNYFTTGGAKGRLETGAPSAGTSPTFRVRSRSRSSRSSPTAASSCGGRQPTAPTTCTARP